MNSVAELLPIGAVAEATGVSVSALRYYDELGLIETAHRVGGKRRFNQETVGRVSFIRRGQDAGFSLEEIQAILDDRVADWAQLVDSKLAELEERRDRLGVMIGLLQEVRECGCESLASCPLANCP